MVILPDETIPAFLNAIKGHKYETVYFVDLFTGMRQGEILGLTWDAIDFDRGTILINKQLQKEHKKGGEYRLVSTKRDKVRKITPALAVMQRLRQHRGIQAEMRLRAGTAWDNPHGLVFTHELGGNFAPFTVYSNLKRIVASIGVPEVRFHDLRHSYAVAALQSGDDVKTVQENLGHHTAAFTLDVYGHVTERMKQDSANRMDAFIKTVQTIG
jgi:integrase